MTGRSGRAAIRMVGLAVVLSAVASGCVSLQASGPVTSVTEGDEGSSQVQTWVSPPTAGEAPSAIVDGFLEAARSGAANQLIADSYLTVDMQKRWKSEQNTVIVLADDSESDPQSPGQNSTNQDEPASAQRMPEAGQANSAQGVQTEAVSDGPEITEVVQGSVLGTVDSSGLYAAAANTGTQTGTYSFGLTETKVGFRISSLPANFGVLMERTDFESSYNRHDVYYVNSQYPTDKLIPTQVYLPAIDSDQEIATALADLVVTGVPDQLDSAVQDAVRGADFKSVQFGDNGDATVTINSRGYCVKTAGACASLGRQLAATLNSLSTKVTAVSVLDQANGQSYPNYSADSSQFTYGLTQGSHSGQTIHAISDAHGVEQISILGSATVTTATYGDGKTKFGQVAVGPVQQGGRTQPLALVSQDGSTLYVPHKTGSADVLTQVYPGGANATGGTVGGLSWDDFGDLWFTVKLNGETSVYRYGQDALSRVTVSGGLNGQVTQVAAAPDGARVAVGYQDGGGSWIAIAAAVPDAEGGWDLELGKPQTVAADWNQVNDFGWYNEESLAVLGIQANSQALGLYQVYADGSSVYDSLTEQPVEASPPANAQEFAWNAGGQPIAAATSDGKHLLYALSVEGQDAQSLGKDVTGTSPSY